MRGTDIRLEAAAGGEFGQSCEDDEGGLQQQRHPGLAEAEVVKPTPTRPTTQLDLLDDDFDAPAESPARSRSRPIGTMGRAHAMNSGERHGRHADADLLPGF